MAERQYPFPSRTRKSSSPAPMIVPSWRESRWLPGFFLFKSFRIGNGRPVQGAFRPRQPPAASRHSRSEPGWADGPKKRMRAFLHGPSILGRLPGFFLPKKLRPARGAAESPFQQFLAFIPSLSRRVMGLLQFPVFSKLILVFPTLGA